jgi:hypothetical protein
VNEGQCAAQKESIFIVTVDVLTVALATTDSRHKTMRTAGPYSEADACTQRFPPDTFNLDARKNIPHSWLGLAPGPRPKDCMVLGPAGHIRGLWMTTTAAKTEH